MNKGRITTVIVLLILALVIIAPPLVHGYIYPSGGDDTTDHLAIFDQLDLSKTTVPQVNYLGQLIVGTPIKAISLATDTSIDNWYLWFNFLVMLGVAFTLYLVTSRLVNRWAGILIVPVAVFSTQSILWLFHCGTIYHIINMFIILPWAMFFLIRWLQEQKVCQAAIACLLFLLFSVFHLSALYLTSFMGLSLAVILIYKHRTECNIASVKKILSLSIVILALAVPATLLLLPTAQGYVSGTMQNAESLVMGVPLTQLVPASSILAYLGLATLCILLFAIAMLVKYGSLERIALKSKLFMVCLLGFIGILLVLFFTKTSPNPARVAMDLATFIAILTACLAGLALVASRKRIVTGVIVVLVLIGISLPLANWFSYSSAVKPIDINTMEYLNEQGAESYSCSTQVAPWIYNRWVEAEYCENGNGEYIVYRSKPMTARTNSELDWFVYNKVSELEDYNGLELEKLLVDEEVKIYVYRNMA